MFASFKLLAAAPFLLSFSPEMMEVVNYPAIHRVMCENGRGTAFRINGNKFLSVAHVTNMTNCTIKGIPLISAPEGGDFSRVEINDGYRGGFPINCDGFVPGQYYFAIGFQGGRPEQRMTVLRATQQVFNGRRILTGYPTVLPGMSGGPVLNAKGEAVGTINTYTPFFRLSGSQELKATSVCAAGG